METVGLTNVSGRNGDLQHFYDGDRMIETRNDPGQMLQQQFWGHCEGGVWL